jgi:hypothetical protein
MPKRRHKTEAILTKLWKVEMPRICGFVGGLGPDAGIVESERGCLGKLLSPKSHHACLEQVVAKQSVSERLAGRLVGRH